MNTAVTIAGVTFQNPVMTGSVEPLAPEWNTVNL